jgi:hypothetical protein
MLESLSEELLEDCFVTKNEVVMEGTSLLSLPEGMQVSQVRITGNGTASRSPPLGGPPAAKEIPD